MNSNFMFRTFTKNKTTEKLEVSTEQFLSYKLLDPLNNYNNFPECIVLIYCISFTEYIS